MDDSLSPFATISELAARIRAGLLNPVDLTEHLLRRIERLDDELNAFRVVTRDRALAEARAAEIALRGGHDLGPLQGIPFAAKDLYDVKGQPTTAGSRILEDNIAKEDSTLVQRLCRAGMILLGKTNTVQFALGGVGINHDHGTPRNPWHRVPHVPGGSSSGSAVAVAAGLVPMALGSDTGGSVRIPSSLCGLVGLKTTVGRLSRAGVYPLSFTLDSMGILARSVEDAAIVYQAIQGMDLKDPTTAGVQSQDVLQGLKDGVKGLRIAFGETVFFDDVDPEVEQAVREAGRVLEFLGARVESMVVPEVAEVVKAEKGSLVIPAEACVANDSIVADDFDRIDPIVAYRMEAARCLAAVDYIKTIRLWEELRRRVLYTLRDVEALIAPTTAIPARPVDTVDATLESYKDHNVRYLRNTAVGNVLNFCAVSVPCGFTRQGLPIGLMVYAKPFQEGLALRIAHAYEQAADWHDLHPDLGGGH